jgi:hypothetical protein
MNKIILIAILIIAAGSLNQASAQFTDYNDSDPGITDANLPESFAEDSGSLQGKRFGQNYTLAYSVTSGQIIDIFFDDSWRLHVKTTSNEDGILKINASSIVFGSMDSRCIVHTGTPMALLDGEETNYEYSALADNFEMVLHLPKGKSNVELVPTFVPETPLYIKNCENPILWAKHTIGGKFSFFIPHFIERGIINGPNDEYGEAYQLVSKIPNWFRSTAGWWSEEKISDEEFLNALQYVVKNEIIKLEHIGSEIKLPNVTIETALKEPSNYLNKKIAIQEILEIIPYEKKMDVCDNETLELIDDPESRYMMLDGKGNSIGIRMTNDEALTDLNVQTIEGVLKIESISDRNCPELEISTIYFAVGELAERLLM